MTRIITLLGGLGLILTAAAPASAQAIDPDVKCFIASDIFSKNEQDPKRRQVAMVANIFFFGRMDARLSAAQLKTQIIAVGRLLKPADLPVVMTDCAKRVQDRQRALQDVGKAIAATMPKPPAAAAPAPTPAPAATPR